MSNQQLALTGVSECIVTVSSDALKERDDLILKAGFIEVVSTPEGQKEAVSLTASLKKWSSEVEKTREILNRPILQAQRALKAAGDEARAPADGQAKRLEKLLSNFHQAQEAKRLEEERQRREAELADLRRQAEIERQHHEAEVAAINARTKAAREAAAAEVKRIERQRLEEELAKEFTPAAPAPRQEVIKPQGAAVTKKIVFEVTDIEALHAAFPHLVELRPRANNINFHINTPGVDYRSIPGLKCWEDTSVAVRSTAAPAPKALQS